MYQYVNKWPRRYVVRRVVVSDVAGYHELECGHQYHFRREYDPISGMILDIVGGVHYHHCEACFNLLPDELRREAVNQVVESGLKKHRAMLAMFDADGTLLPTSPGVGGVPAGDVG